MRIAVPSLITTYDGAAVPRGRKETPGSFEHYDRRLLRALRAAGLVTRAEELPRWITPEGHLRRPTGSHHSAGLWFEGCTGWVTPEQLRALGWRLEHEPPP